MAKNYKEPHICQCLTRLYTVSRHSIVTISGNRKATGYQFVERVLSLAHKLVKIGIRNGHIVAISAFNSDVYLEWILAVAFVGAIVTPLNYRWSFEEAKLALLEVNPVMLVTDESCSYWYAELHGDELPSLRWHISLDLDSSILTTDILEECLTQNVPLNYSWAPHGAVIICFTSGTTGKPKGVTISHSALIIQSLAKIAIVGYREDDVYLHTAPLCHIGGLSSAMTMLLLGGCHVLIPKFEAKSALEAIDQYQVTSLITVPAIMATLTSFIRVTCWKGKDCITKILNGGGGLSIDLINDAIKIFPRAKLLSAYGMTETCSTLTFMTLYEPTTGNHTRDVHAFSMAESSSPQRQGVCVGLPAPHVEIKIFGKDSFQIGNILTRGPHTMLGYWNRNPTDPSNSNSSDDMWLDTGDIGSIDDYGYLWLIGRKKNQIKTGGENVYPEEVEAILSRHPGLSSSIVVSTPDAHLTEKIIACVELRENWKWCDRDCEPLAENKEHIISSELLRQYCRDKKLTRFKIPKLFISWTKPFPVTASGKIRRDQVYREVMTHLQSVSSKL